MDRRVFLKSAGVFGLALKSTRFLQPDLVFFDNFNQGIVSPMRSFGGEKFEKAFATVENGVLRLRVDRRPDGAWRGAGVALDLPRVYGRFTARVRADPATTRVVGLLWPTNADAPPEIDFYEMGGNRRARQENTQTLHYGPDIAHRTMIHTKYPGDFTRWHDVGVVWRPGYLSYRCDGVERARVESNRVPGEPMRFGVQTAAVHTAETPMRASMWVDWVRVFA